MQSVKEANSLVNVTNEGKSDMTGGGGGEIGDGAGAVSMLPCLREATPRRGSSLNRSSRSSVNQPLNRNRDIKISAIGDLLAPATDPDPASTRRELVFVNAPATDMQVESVSGPGSPSPPAAVPATPDSSV